MEELSLEDLQAQLQAIQDDTEGESLLRTNKGRKGKKLSTRNCIELVNLLREKGLVEVVYTLDGEEFVTLAQLRKEVAREVLASRGRTDNRAIQTSLNVDLNYVEQAIKDVANCSKQLYDDTQVGAAANQQQHHQQQNSLAKEAARNAAKTLGCRMFYLESGDVVTDAYLDRVCQEVHEILEERGKVTCGAIAEKIQLPLVFLKEILWERTKNPESCGENMQQETPYVIPALWRQDQQALYTLDYIEMQRQQLVAAAIGVTRPIIVEKLVDTCYDSSNVLSITEMDKSLCLSIFPELASKLPGTVNGPIYTPYVFLLSQRHAALSFFSANGYISFERLKKLRIEDGMDLLQRSAKSRNFSDIDFELCQRAIDKQKLDELTLSLAPDTKLVKLNSCIISNAFVDHITVIIEDTAASGTFINLCDDLPPEIDVYDVCMLADVFRSNHDRTHIHDSVSPSIRLLECYEPISAQLKGLEASKPSTDVSKTKGKTDSKSSKGKGKSSSNKPSKKALKMHTGSQRTVQAVLIGGNFVLSCSVLDNFLLNFQKQAEVDANIATKSLELERSIRKKEEGRAGDEEPQSLEELRMQLEENWKDASIAAKRYRRRQHAREPLITPQESYIMLSQCVADTNGTEDLIESEISTEALDFLREQDSDFNEDRLLSPEWEQDENIGEEIAGKAKITSILMSLLLRELWAYIKTIYGNSRQAAFKGSSEQQEIKRLTPTNKRACLDAAKYQLDVAMQLLRRLLNSMSSWPRAEQRGAIHESICDILPDPCFVDTASENAKSMFNVYSLAYAYVASLDATILWCCASTGTSIRLDQEETLSDLSSSATIAPFDAIIQGVNPIKSNDRHMKAFTISELFGVPSSSLHLTLDCVPFDDDNQTNVFVLHPSIRSALKAKLEKRLESTRAYATGPTVVDTSTGRSDHPQRLSPEDCKPVETLLDYFELFEGMKRGVQKAASAGDISFLSLTDDSVRSSTSVPVIPVDAKQLKDRIQILADALEIWLNNSTKKTERSGIFHRRQCLLSLCDHGTDWHQALSMSVCYLWHKHIKTDMVSVPMVDGKLKLWYITGIAKYLDSVLQDNSISRTLGSMLKYAYREELQLQDSAKAEPGDSPVESFDTLKTRLLDALHASP